MINVRLYQEIVLPYFQIKHGQFAAVALTRTEANKMLRKVWEAFIIRRDRLVLRKHQKNLSDQRKYDAQLKNAQQSAGQQIDNRVDNIWLVWMRKSKASLKKKSKANPLESRLLHLINLFWNVNSQTRSLERNPLLNLLHLLNVLDKQKL